MEEPEFVFPNGTRVITNEVLPSTAGMIIQVDTLRKRRPAAPGRICGIVGGHGGDVYWVKHDDGVVAPYGWMDFELDDVRQSKSIEARLRKLRGL